LLKSPSFSFKTGTFLVYILLEYQKIYVAGMFVLKLRIYQ